MIVLLGKLGIVGNELDKLGNFGILAVIKSLFKAEFALLIELNPAGTLEAIPSERFERSVDGNIFDAAKFLIMLLSSDSPNEAFFGSGNAELLTDELLGDVEPAKEDDFSLNPFLDV